MTLLREAKNKLTYTYTHTHTHTDKHRHTQTHTHRQTQTHTNINLYSPLFCQLYCPSVPHLREPWWQTSNWIIYGQTWQWWTSLHLGHLCCHLTLWWITPLWSPLSSHGGGNKDGYTKIKTLTLQRGGQQRERRVQKERERGERERRKGDKHRNRIGFCCVGRCWGLGSDVWVYLSSTVFMGGVLLVLSVQYWFTG